MAVSLLAMAGMASAQVSEETVKSLGAPDTIETSIGTLEFKDGAPTAETAQKVYDTLDFTRALDAFLNSYGGASAYAIRQGLQASAPRPTRCHLLRTDGFEVAVPHGQRRHRLLLQRSSI